MALTIEEQQLFRDEVEEGLDNVTGDAGAVQSSLIQVGEALIASQDRANFADGDIRILQTMIVDIARNTGAMSVSSYFDTIQMTQKEIDNYEREIDAAIDGHLTACDLSPLLKQTGAIYRREQGQMGTGRWNVRGIHVQLVDWARDAAKAAESGLCYTIYLQDDFITPQPAPLHTPRTCDPGPGQLVVTQVNSSVYVDGNQRLRYDRGAATGYGECGLATVASYSRLPGLLIQSDFIPSSANAQAYVNSFADAQALTTTPEGGFQANDGRFAARDGSVWVDFVSLYDGTRTEKLSLISRADGYFYLHWRLGAAEPTLVWVAGIGNSSQLFGQFLNVSQSAGEMDNFVVADGNWDPTPAADDSFASNPGDLDGRPTDGLAAPEAGGEGLRWSSASGQWEATGTAAAPVAPVPADQPRAVAVLDCFLADSLIQSKLRIGGAEANGVVARYSDNGNFWCTRITGTAHEIVEYSGGTPTVQASAVVSLSDADYTNTVTLDGAEIVSYIDGANRIAYSSMTSNLDQTRVGMRSESVTRTTSSFVVWPRHVVGYPMFPSSPDPDVLYFLNDQYNTQTLSSLMVSPRLADPGPGIETLVVAADSSLRVNDNLRLESITGALSLPNNKFYLSNAFPRAPGRICRSLVRRYEAATVGPAFGFTDGAAAAPAPDDISGSAYYFGTTGVFAQQSASSQTQIGEFSPFMGYDCYVISRGQGCHLIIRGGNYAEPTLLWVDKLDAHATQKYLFQNHTSEYSLDDWQIPSSITYAPTPITSDSFDRPNGALGSTDNAGAEEGGEQIRPWAALSGQWLIAGNAAAPVGGDPGPLGWVTCVETGQADVVCGLTVSANASKGILLRWESPARSFHVSATVGDAGSGSISIREFSGGDWVVRATAALTITSGADYELLAIAHGPEIAGYVSNGNRVHYSMASGAQSATLHGMYSSSAAGRCDNFAVWPRILTDLPDLPESPSPETTWLFLDRFVIDRVSPLSTPRACEYGPGEAVLAQTTGTMSTGGSQLALVGANGPWADQAFISNYGIPRAAGRMLEASFRSTGADGPAICWSSDATPAFGGSIQGAAYTATASGHAVTYASDALLQIAAHTWDVSEVITARQVLRGNGVFLLLNNRLLWLTEQGSNASVHPQVNNKNAEAYFFYVAVPEEVSWEIRPLASDSFAGAQQPLHGRPADGAGAQEPAQTTPQWENVNGSWEIEGGSARPLAGVPAQPFNLAALECNQSDVLLTTKIHPEADTNLFPGLAARVVDADNCWILDIDDATPTKQARIIERTGGTNVTRASASASLATGQWHIVQGRLDGDQITMAVGEAMSVTYSGATAHQNATRHGIRAQLPAARFDDWAAFEIAPAGAPEITIPAQNDLIYDEFPVDATFTVETQHSCQPGPGLLRMVILAGTSQISGGIWYTTGGGSSFSSTGFVANAIPRQAGQMGIFRVTVTIANRQMVSGFQDTPALESWMRGGGIYYTSISPGRIYCYGGGYTPAGDYPVNEPCDIAIIKRSVGSHFLYRGGPNFPEWTLLALGNSSETYSNIYLSVANRSHEAEFSSVRVPLELWTPTAILCDTFSGPDGAPIANWFTDGQGCEEGQIASRQWNAIGAWTIQNQAAQAPNATANENIYLESETSDVLIECSYDGNGHRNSKGIMFRRVDADNFWAYVGSETDGVMYLYEVTSGTRVERSRTTVANGQLVDIQVAADGQLIQAWLGGESRLLYGSASAHQSATAHGFMQMQVGSAGSRCANLNIWRRRPQTPAVLG